MRFHSAPLDAIGSKLSGGRYNPRERFEALYLAATPTGLLREARLSESDQSGREIIIPREPQVYLTIAVSLQNVVDLCDSRVQALLEVTEADLLAEWKPLVHAGRTPITQLIGTAAFDAGVEGLIVPSARLIGTANLVVLVDRLRVGSSVEITQARGFAPTTIVRIEGALDPP